MSTFQQPGSQQDNPLVAISGVVFIVALFWPLFAASPTIAVLAIAYAALALALGIAAERNKKATRLTSALLFASAVVPLAAGWLVFRWHWFGFAVVEWLTTGLYVAALICGLLWALNGPLRLLAALLAVAMVVSSFVLPTPQGGEALHWSVLVDVHDEDGDPLYEAMVQCVVIDEAVPTPSLDAFTQGHWVSDTHFTNRHGRSQPFEFGDDHRLRPVLCAAEKNNSYRDNQDGYAGYAPTLSGMLFPHQGENNLALTLRENPHPGSAYLKIRLGADSKDQYGEFAFELWDQPPPAYQPYSVYSADAPHPIVTGEWLDFLPWSPAAQWVDLFAVDNRFAEHALFLRYGGTPRRLFVEKGPPSLATIIRTDPLRGSGRTVLTVDLPGDPH